MTATLRLWKDFYPRPPRGGRLTVPAPESFKDEFLSTPSARRATALDELTTGRKGNFYPRPPRGGRRLCHLRYQRTDIISIHALREEGD